MSDTFEFIDAEYATRTTANQPGHSTSVAGRPGTRVRCLGPSQVHGRNGKPAARA